MSGNLLLLFLVCSIALVAVQSAPANEPTCTTECHGGPHDKCTTCGSTCPLTCDKPQPVACTMMCLINVCECESGYARDSSGQCIPKEECPST